MSEGRGCLEEGCLGLPGVFPDIYRSIQIDYRQRFFFWEELNSDYRNTEELISITETDLWEFQQKISYYRYRFSLKFQLISITDGDFGLKTNLFCNHFGYNGIELRFSLGNEGKDGKNLNSQTWPGTPRRPAPRHPRPPNHGPRQVLLVLGQSLVAFI